MRSLILCNSSLTPGRLNPSFNPLGRLNSGGLTPPTAFLMNGVLFPAGFFGLYGPAIMTSVFLFDLFIL
jgi:hypothetical protein